MPPESTLSGLVMCIVDVLMMDRLGYKRIFNPDDAVRANAANRTYYVKSGLAKILEGA